MKGAEGLKIRGFPRLLTSYTVNEFGDSVGVVALALLVYGETGEALPTAALFLAGKFVPAFLAPLVTARFDQGAVRRVLPAIYLLEAAVFAALGAISESFVLSAVLALALLDGTLALAGRSLTRGVIGAMSETPERLRSANALINVGFAVASVGGAAVGGFLVSEVGFAAALYADAATFAIIALLLATSSDLPTPTATRDPFLDRFRAGLAYVRGRRSMALMIAGEALALVLFTLVVPVEVIYARDALGTDEAGFGLLLASWGGGIVIGSLVHLASARSHPANAIVLSTLAIGLAYCFMSIADTLLVACLISLVGGAGNGVQWVSIVTALQERTPPELHARVMGLLESINAALPGIGFVLGGILAAVWGPRTAFAVAGIGTIALVGVGLLLLWRLGRRGASTMAEPV